MSLIILAPFLLLWIIIIPALIFRSLYKNRKKLDNYTVRYSLGFLYNEYRQTIYYWEMIKIYVKLTINVIINIYEAEISLKGFFIILILLMYNALSMKYRPFNMRKYN